MASLPKPNPEWVPMTAEELLAIRGTPEFEVELRRQMEALAEHQREHPEELLPVDEGDMVPWDSGEATSSSLRLRVSSGSQGRR